MSGGPAREDPKANAFELGRVAGTVALPVAIGNGFCSPTKGQQ